MSHSPVACSPDPPTAVIGCDVGKSTVVTFNNRTGIVTTVPNALADLERFVLALEPGCLIVCESTGRYEAALLQVAITAGRSAHRADPRKVKMFIRSHGTLGKTDSLDAKALARYGEDRHATLTRWQVPDAARDRLQALVRTRRDLVAQRQATLNRRDAPGAKPVAARLQAVVDCLAVQIKALEDDIAALVEADLDLARDIKALRGIAGIGAATAPALLALMPELGRLDRRQAAALAGLAPHPNQSGKADRYRPVRGGRPEVRRVLFMAALVAARHHPTLKVAYQTLRANGKKPIVAIGALMRRLVVIANAVLRDANTTAHVASQVS